MATSLKPVPMVRPRKRREIEAKATRLARQQYPDQVAHLEPIPVDHFFEFRLPQLMQIEVGVSADLEFGVEGEARPGTSGRPPLLLLSERVFMQMTEGMGRARFTGAHECGHGIFHLPEISETLVDNGIPSLYRSQEIPRYRDPEWQSNVFAGAFLLPTEAVQAFVDRFGASHEQLARRFNVSYAAAEMRLRLMRGAGFIA